MPTAFPFPEIYARQSLLGPVFGAVFFLGAGIGLRASWSSVLLDGTEVVHIFLKQKFWNYQSEIVNHT